MNQKVILSTSFIDPRPNQHTLYTFQVGKHRSSYRRMTEQRLLAQRADVRLITLPTQAQNLLEYSIL